jgi:hypothetical protein
MPLTRQLTVISPEAKGTAAVGSRARTREGGEICRCGFCIVRLETIRNNDCL